jgi:hypothetical protein
MQIEMLRSSPPKPNKTKQQESKDTVRITTLITTNELEQVRIVSEGKDFD